MSFQQRFKYASDDAHHHTRCVRSEKQKNILALVPLRWSWVQCIPDPPLFATSPSFLGNILSQNRDARSYAVKTMALLGKARTIVMPYPRYIPRSPSVFAMMANVSAKLFPAKCERPLCCRVLTTSAGNEMDQYAQPERPPQISVLYTGMGSCTPLC